MSRLLLSELELAADDEEWGELAVASGNIFATPEWISTWWRHFGAGRRLLATACRDADGRLVGVLPLYEWKRRRLRLARFIGHGPGDALGPVCRPADRADVGSALEELLRSEGVDVLVGEQVPGEEGWSKRLGARVFGHEGSPVLGLDGADWERVLASWSKKLRSEVRYRERKFARDHRVGFRLADDAERLDQDFDRLFALHRARWTDASDFGRDEAFHRDFGLLAFARGWLRLWLLEVDDDVRAAWYGFRFANFESHYQGGRDPDPVWDRYGLGFMLLVQSIRAATADGAREYRFLRGGEDYKYRFASHDDGLESFVLGSGALGEAAVRVGSRFPRIQRKLIRA